MHIHISHTYESTKMALYEVSNCKVIQEYVTIQSWEKVITLLYKGQNYLCPVSSYSEGIPFTELCAIVVASRLVMD